MYYTTNKKHGKVVAIQLCQHTEEHCECLEKELSEMLV